MPNERTIVAGPLAARTKETDGYIWIPGAEFAFDANTWTFTRGGVGNYFMRKTAGLNTTNCVVNLEEYVINKIGADPNAASVRVQGLSAGADFLHDIRGAQIVSLECVYAIGTAAITSQAVSLQHTTYANNVAPSVATAIAVTGSLATATNAQPYVTTITVTTPVVIGLNTAQVVLWLELNIVATTTAVYDLYGIGVNFNYNLL